MIFRRKKRTLTNLESSFGKIKTQGFNFDLINKYHERKNKSNIFQTLSDQTCNDLDFDLFFCFVDRTSSKIGQQYLYHQLKTIDIDQKFAHQEEVIKYLYENPKERLNLQYKLNKLNNQQSCYIADLFQEEIEPKSKWYFLFPILSLIAFISIILSFLNPTFFLILLFLFPLHLLIHYGLKRKTNLFLNSVPSLLALGAIAKNLSKHSILKDSTPGLEGAIRTISFIRRKMSFFKLEQKVDSDMEAAYWFLLEIIKITFLLEPLLLFSSLDKIRGKSDDIERVFCYVGKIDTYLSIASLRKGLNKFCIPTFEKNLTHVQFKDLRHPLVSDCVSNSIRTSASILLTGSNMSGKTTFIRSIGLNYISGMTLNTCFASAASLPIAKLYSVIRIEDDLMDSSSYFYKEVDEIKNIVQQSSKEYCSIILLDELFKGTNTIERIASAKAVLSYLQKQNCQIFVSTHDIELTSMLDNQFKLFYFTENIIDSKIHFDYKLKEGILEYGNAIRILEINKYPKEITASANAIVSNMKRG